MRPGALTVRQSKGFLMKSLWDSQPDPEEGVGATGPLTPATPHPREPRVRDAQAHEGPSGLGSCPLGLVSMETLRPTAGHKQRRVRASKGTSINTSIRSCTDAASGAGAEPSGVRLLPPN